MAVLYRSRLKVCVLLSNIICVGIGGGVAFIAYHPIAQYTQCMNVSFLIVSDAGIDEEWPYCHL